MEEKILEILTELNEDADFSASEDFVEDGLLDSFDIVTLVGELEDKFDIEIEPDDILPENLSNMDSIMKLLSKYGVNA